MAKIKITLAILILLTLILLSGCNLLTGVSPSELVPGADCNANNNADCPRGCPSNTKCSYMYSIDSIQIASWNLQIFGDEKASNPEVINFIAKLMQDFDVIVIQEIKDKDGSAWKKLCSRLEDRTCIVSSRAGRTSSKEQYLVAYRSDLELIETRDFNPDPEDRWERPPFKITLSTQQGYKFTIWTIHTKPDDALSEIQFLDNLIKPEGNVLVMGDLNADCSYYQEDLASKVHFTNDNWTWVIHNQADTTVSSTDCAYDRIILSNDAMNEMIESRVYTGGIEKFISDHYLVYVVLDVNE